METCEIDTSIGCTAGWSKVTKLAKVEDGGSASYELFQCLHSTEIAEFGRSFTKQPLPFRYYVEVDAELQTLKQIGASVPEFGRR
jgi:hypothetical protein